MFGGPITTTERQTSLSFFGAENSVCSICLFIRTAKETNRITVYFSKEERFFYSSTRWFVIVLC